MNVLIVRLSAMGDIIHALPLAPNLKNAGHRVGWVVERPFASLLSGNPWIDRVFAVDTRRWRGRPFSRSTRDAIGGLRRDVSNFHPDVSLDPQANEKSLSVSRIAGAPRIVLDDRSVRTSWSRRFARVRVTPSESAPHFVDKTLALLAPLRVPVMERAPDARYLVQGAGPASRGFLESVARPFALYHPGAGWANKSWGEERFAELARAVKDRLGIHPVVSWGPGDEARARTLGRMLQAPEIPAVGFADLAAIAAEAEFFAAGDTGPLHLADALCVPTVALFGPTDAVRNGAFRRNGLLFSRPLPCAPCLARYNETKACLAMIDPLSVAKAVEGWRRRS